MNEFDECDFPAAHSMDSGWFAVDSEGKLALFETGEAGAMLVGSEYTTGESHNAATNMLYDVYIAPWFARHIPVDEMPKPDDMGGYEYAAHFEDGESARLFARTSDEVTLLEGRAEVLRVVKDSDELRQKLISHRGFIGLAPASLEAFIYELIYDTKLESPFAIYNHGDWDIPGDYVKDVEASTRAPLEVNNGALHELETVFAEHAHIELGEIAREVDFISWSGADLRGVYPEPAPRKVPPGKGLWSWLSGLLGKKKEDEP